MPAGDDVYIALGTTIKVADSQAAFKALDCDTVVALAQSNLSKQTRGCAADGMRISVVSAMGAGVQSGGFYNRTKGQMELKLSTPYAA